MKNGGRVFYFAPLLPVLIIAASSVFFSFLAGVVVKNQQAISLHQTESMTMPLPIAYNDIASYSSGGGGGGGIVVYESTSYLTVDKDGNCKWSEEKK